MSNDKLEDGRHNQGSPEDRKEFSLTSFSINNRISVLVLLFLIIGSQVLSEYSERSLTGCDHPEYHCHYNLSRGIACGYGKPGYTKA